MINIPLKVYNEISIPKSFTNTTLINTLTKFKMNETINLIKTTSATYKLKNTNSKKVKNITLKSKSSTNVTQKTLTTKSTLKLQMTVPKPTQKVSTVKSILKPKILTTTLFHKSSAINPIMQQNTKTTFQNKLLIKPKAKLPRSKNFVTIATTPIPSINTKINITKLNTKLKKKINDSLMHNLTSIENKTKLIKLKAQSMESLSSLSLINTKNTLKIISDNENDIISDNLSNFTTPNFSIPDTYQNITHNDSIDFSK